MKSINKIHVTTQVPERAPKGNERDLKKYLTLNLEAKNQKTDQIIPYSI